MDIDVIIFTLSAPVWHIQWHNLHLYIMGNATVPWFGPIPPIGCQGTQKVTGGTTTRYDYSDRWHDDGNGQQGDSRHDNGNGRHDDDDWWQDNNDRRHNGGKVQQGDRWHDDRAGITTSMTGSKMAEAGGMTTARCSRATCGT